MRSLFLLLSICFFGYTQAQELKCNVTVNAQKIQTANPNLFVSLEKSITQFMNDRKWTDDVFKPHERIECDILLTLEEQSGENSFKGRATIQAARPVYGTSYKSPILKVVDEEFTFNYIEFQPMDFNENVYNNNLTSLLGFYAYYIIALDYESFSKNGGTEYLNKVEAILNNVQTNGNKGWQPFDGIRTRYWLHTDLMKGEFAPFRESLYSYHRLGLDVMATNPEEGRKVMMEALRTWIKIQEVNRTSYIFVMMMDAKNDELFGAFINADKATREEAYKYLSRLDPKNIGKYGALKK